TIASYFMASLAACRRPLGRRLLPFRRLLPGIGALHRVFLEPVELDVHLEELVAQLAPAVWLARRDVEVRGNAVALERPVHLDGLRHRHADVALSDQEDRRRLRL